MSALKNWFGRTTLNTRVWMVMTVVVLGLIGQTVMSGIESRRVQMAVLANTLEQHVTAAIAIADAYHARAAKGLTSDLEARVAALDDIQAMRWSNNTGYVFAFDSALTMRMHPLRSADIGKNIRDDADGKGFHQYVAMLEADTKDGHGMTRYTQIMPKTNELKDKISYSSWYKPWDLHFISGAYFDDIDAAFRAQLGRDLLRSGAIAALALLMVWLSMSSIRTTVGGEPRDAVHIAGRIAGGDLRSDGGEYASASLLGALERMRSTLSSIVSEVQEGAHVVSTTSAEIARGNDDLSQRTQEQASSLEETAASMEEMTATVKQNAENATAADRLSRHASGEAEKGGAVVGEAMEAMRAIGDSSRRIGDIVGLIDEIAFQTNLLALNAAVEAARAGEQGRGFAVVAAEVRRLAQSSAAASREIKGLIAESGERVEVGASLVEQSSVALRDIVASVKKVTDIVAEIAAASAEQSAGVDQVNLAIAQIDQVTQENAALVEEAAAAAKSMQDQAHSLTDQVAFFIVDGGGRAEPMARASAAERAAHDVTFGQSATVKKGADAWAEFA
ncbi:methyl-accepting chemotaxis sensory transducer with Cache sensor [Luteibacter sp. OK325]|uniref:methyl-accepting chemotaxis protein n=1 Tax=Luteibacter sp. OK325 TaxID=2135670 RepID=UPI000D3412D8|nr:methyl-accepting chemotaxis protein [Luteibacter sp. OK325]PTR27321.1 methyl-accepting chemotaxis sensory transducer with Cache sensor [Luteibacter sp. OK325]